MTSPMERGSHSPAVCLEDNRGTCLRSESIDANLVQRAHVGRYCAVVLRVHAWALRVWVAGM